MDFNTLYEEVHENMEERAVRPTYTPDPSAELEEWVHALYQIGAPLSAGYKGDDLSHYGMEKAARLWFGVPSKGVDEDVHYKDRYCEMRERGEYPENFPILPITPTDQFVLDMEPGGLRWADNMGNGWIYYGGGRKLVTEWAARGQMKLLYTRLLECLKTKDWRNGDDLGVLRVYVEGVKDIVKKRGRPKRLEGRSFLCWSSMDNPLGKEIGRLGELVGVSDSIVLKTGGNPLPTKEQERDAPPQEVINYRLGVGRLVRMDTDKRIAEFGQTGHVFMNWIGGRTGSIGMSTCKVVGNSAVGKKEWPSCIWVVQRAWGAQSQPTDGMLVVLPDKVWDSLAWLMQTGMFLVPQLGYGPGPVWMGWSIPSWSGEPLHLAFRDKRRLCTGNSVYSKRLKELHLPTEMGVLGMLGRGILTTDWPSGDTAMYMIPEAWGIQLGDRLKAHIDPKAIRATPHPQVPPIEAILYEIRDEGFPAVYDGELGRIKVQVEGLDEYRPRFHYRFLPVSRKDANMGGWLYGDTMGEVALSSTIRAWSGHPGPVLDHVIEQGGGWIPDPAAKVTISEYFKMGYEGPTQRYIVGPACIYQGECLQWDDGMRVVGSRIEELCGITARAAGRRRFNARAKANQAEQGTGVDTTATVE